MANQCVILLGGLGSRLGEVAKTTPKPLLPVGGVPFVEVLIAEARRRGFDAFLLLAGHRSEVVSSFLAERRIETRFDCAVTVSVEPTPLGTGGALVHAAEHLQDDFLLLNGDTWFDFNWLDLVARARASGAKAAMALREIAQPDRYETIELDGPRVTRIHPRGRDLRSAMINGGAYYLTRSVLDHLERPSSLEAALLPELARRGELNGQVYPGFFIDIGVPETLAAADRLVPDQRLRAAGLLDFHGVLSAETDRLAWVDGARAAIKTLNDNGYYVFAVGEVDRRLRAEAARDLAVCGAAIDDWLGGPAGAAEWPVRMDGSFRIASRHSPALDLAGGALPTHAFSHGDLAAFIKARPNRPT